MLWSRCRICGYLLVYLALAGLIVIALGRINWLTYYHLASHGIRTQGYVIKTNCADHNGFYYRFSINENVYEGLGSGGSGNPDCHTLDVGNPVTVYYLSDSPSINIAGDASMRLTNETVSILLAALLLPAIVTVAIYFIMRGKTRQI